MQKENGNKNLLRSNTRNQRQQIEPRRHIKNRRVRDKIYCEDPIENGGHLSLLPNRLASLHCHIVASAKMDQLSTPRRKLPTMHALISPAPTIHVADPIRHILLSNFYVLFFTFLMNRAFTFAPACVLLFVVSDMRAATNSAERVGEIQKALQAEKIDGWLFYDFRGSDVIALRVLKLDQHAVSRPRANRSNWSTGSSRPNSMPCRANVRNTAAGKNNTSSSASP